MADSAGKQGSNSLTSLEPSVSQIPCQGDTVVVKPSFASIVKTSQQRGVMACVVVRNRSEGDSAQKTLKDVAKNIDGYANQVKTTVNCVIKRLRECPETVSRAELEVLCAQLEAVPALCDNVSKLCTALTTAIDRLNGENDGLKSELIAARGRITLLESSLADARIRIVKLEKQIDTDRRAVLVSDVVYRINDYLYRYYDAYATVGTLDQYAVVNVKWAVELRDFITQQYALLDQRNTSQNKSASPLPALLRCKVTAKRMTDAALPIAHATMDECATAGTEDLRKLVDRDEMLLLEVLQHLVGNCAAGQVFTYFDPTTGTSMRKKYVDYPLLKPQ